MKRYQSHINLIDFLSSFQDGIVSTDSYLGEINGNIMTSNNVAAKDMQLEKAVVNDQYVKVIFEIPGEIISPFYETIKNELIVPPLPIEFIKEVYTPSSDVYNEFANHFSGLGIKLELLHFKLIIGDIENRADNEILEYIVPSYRGQVSKLSSRVRMARAIVFAFRAYRKTYDPLKTNFDLSVHPALIFLNGGPINATKSEIDSSLKRIEKAFITIAQKRGFKLSFSQIRKPSSLGPEIIIEAIQEVFSAEKSNDLIKVPPNLKKTDTPDRVLFKMAIKQIWNKPFSPNDAWERLINLLEELRAYETKEDDDYKKFRVMALSLINAIKNDNITYSELISKNGEKYPALCALMTYYGSDDFSDKGRLTQRLQAFKASPIISWATIVFYGSQNGYAAPLSLDLKLDKRFQTMFKTAVIRLFKFNLKMTKKETVTLLNEPVFDEKSYGLIQFSMELAGGYIYFVELYNPIKRLADLIIDNVNRSISDESLRKIILNDALNLSLPSLPGFQSAVDLVLPLKNCKFQGSGQELLFSGSWSILWATDSMRWQKFFDYLIQNRNLLEKHINNHEGEWNTVTERWSKLG